MIPVCYPFIGEKELEYVTDCVKTNWISSKGKYVEEFENNFAKYCDFKYGVATTNGTTALHLALACLGISKGDEVIIPSFTMIATAFAVVYCGAKPVLVDAKPDTWNIDVKKIEEKITDKTKAIMPVHIYGHPCDMDPIMKLAKKYNLYVVEDAAEVHGAEYKGKKAGGIGDIGCFSFYANKIITCGEGGMIITNDDKIAEKAKSLKNLSFPKGKRIYKHQDVGYNYRMTNIQAAIGLAQLEKIDELIARRRKNAHLYNKLLKNINGITLPVEKEWAKNVYWMYGIVLDKSTAFDAESFAEELAEKGIQTRPFFYPLNLQPVFQNFKKTKCPVAEKIEKQGLYLPSGLGLKDWQIKRVVREIKKILK